MFHYLRLLSFADYDYLVLGSNITDNLGLASFGSFLGFFFLPLLTESTNLI